MTTGVPDSSENDLVHLLQEYFERHKQSLDLETDYFSNKLKQLNKSEEQIREIFLEWEYDWERTQSIAQKVKKAETNMYLGYLIVMISGIITVLIARNYWLLGTIKLHFFGVMAIGLLLVFNGINKQRMAKRSKTRLMLKWKNWK